MSPFHQTRKILLVALLGFVFAPALAVDQIEWMKSFDSALEKAAKEKKFIVLDISASW